MLRPVLLMALCCTALLGGCSTRYVATEHGPQAYYQTGFPLRDTSRDLEQAFRSVKRIQITGIYETFHFTIDDGVTAADLRVPSTYDRATERFTFDHAKAGTATIIARTGNALRLITNEHVTRMPDTVIAYYDDRRSNRRPADRRVESVAILRARTNVIVGIPEATQFRLVARDSVVDVALITVDIDPGDYRQQLPVLPVRQGDPSRLAWGSFVYVLGYPRGFQMVTRAIVSDPRRDRDHGFLLDGLFNRGISGGLVLAVRGDTGELEWIGLAMSTSAQLEHLLVPDRAGVDEQGILLPYQGNLFSEQVSRIDYGITFSVPMTAITRFLRTVEPPASSPSRP
jgi:hypothetical protein